MKMTFQEDGKEDAGSDKRTPALGSISSRGLLASVREREDNVPTIPNSAPPRSKGSGGNSTPPRSEESTGVFPSSPRTPVPVTSPARDRLHDTSPLRTNINKFLTPSKTFNRLRDEKEELSKLTPTPPSQDFRDGFTLPLVGEVKPRAVLQFAQEWLRNPKNIALLIWGLGVVVSGAILFMVMVGMLNAIIPSKDARNTWFEVSNQIINALFTLMALYLHPQRCFHLHMLWRWRASDIVKLRKVYCKNGTRKPHEWGHMLVMVLLLQVNCIAQYALCGLNWGYRRAERPAIGVAICLCTSMGAGAAAGIYNIVSPLGKDFEVESDDPEEMEKRQLGNFEHESEFIPHTKIYRMLEKRVSFAYKDEGSVVQKPEWKGGVFDIRNDPPVSILSALCCVCVFGWNMERLGFGNRFVHIITFVLICTAPFWIFNLAALNIENYYVRNSISGSGIALCAFGLLYGGYWRIRMRERFNLPGNGLCCGKPAVTDCFQWLFLSLCSLCQEVRTAEFYDIKDDRFYSRSRMGPDSPLVGIASPHTAGPTLSAVREMPNSLHKMDLDDVELRAHDSPYKGSDRSNNALAPPTPVIATRNPSFALSDSPQRLSPCSPSNPNSFLHPGTSPSNNPFVNSVHAHPSGSPSGTYSSTNPSLQPESHSKSSSPVRSSYPGSSNISLAQAGLTSGASELRLGSPLRSPHRVSLSSNPVSGPEMSSPDAEEIPLYSPPRVGSYPNALGPPAFSSASPVRTSSEPSNPFLQPEGVASAGEHLPNPPETAAMEGSHRGVV